MNCSALLIGVCCVTASAVPISYTVTETNSSATLGAGPINPCGCGETVTITLVGDTANIISFPGGVEFGNIGPATVTVQAHLCLDCGASDPAPTTVTGAFTDVMEVISVDAGTFAVVGIEGVTQNLGLVFTNMPGSYALHTAIGPVTGNGTPGSNHPIPTSAGTFVYSGFAPNTPATFSATFATPEPRTLGLIGAAIPLLWIGRRLSNN